jgi:hypothetical protein
MHVQVKDGLSGAWANIEDRTISLFNFPLTGDLGSRKVTLADQFGL